MPFPWFEKEQQNNFLKKVLDQIYPWLKKK